MAPFPFDMSPHAKNYSLRQQNDTLSTQAERCRERERAQGKDVERSPAGAVHTDLEEAEVKRGCFILLFFLSGLGAILKRKFTLREKGKFNFIHFSLQTVNGGLLSPRGQVLSFTEGKNSTKWTRMSTSSSGGS